MMNNQHRFDALDLSYSSKEASLAKAIEEYWMSDDYEGPLPDSDEDPTSIWYQTY